MKQRRIKSMITFVLVFVMVFGVQIDVAAAQVTDVPTVQKDVSDDTTDNATVSDTSVNTEDTNDMDTQEDMTTNTENDSADTEDDATVTDTSDHTDTQEDVTTETESDSVELNSSIIPAGLADDSDTEYAPQSDDTMSGTCGATENDNVTWKLEQNNEDSSNPTYTLTLSGSGSMENWNYISGSMGSAVVSSPWSAYSSKITDITVADGIIFGKRAFQGLSSLKSFTFPQGITDIPEYTFADCTSLENITIPDTVTSIGEAAFRACDKMTEVTLPGSVTTYGTYLFRGCANLRKVNLPNSMTSLPVGIFSECPRIKTVTLPEGMSELGAFSFNQCTGLTEITLPSGITAIGQGAFNGCSEVKKVDLSNTNLRAVSNGVFKDLNKLSQLYLPETVTSIDHNAFAGSGLPNIQLPSRVDTIKGTAFSNCSNMVAVSIFAEPLKPKSNESTGGGGDYWQRVGSNIFKTIGSGSVIYFIGEELPLAFTGDYLGSRIDKSKTSISVTNGGTFKVGTAFSSGQFSTPIKVGYAFKGWYDNKELSGTAVPTPEAGKTYYAKWEAKAVSTITFKETTNLSKTYDTVPVSLSKTDCTVSGSTGEVIFAYQVKEDNDWKDIDSAPINVGEYRVKAVVAEDDTYAGAESSHKEFAISKAMPTYTTPTGLTAIVGQTLADVKLSDGFTWQDDTTASVGTAGTHKFKVTYTPADTANYNTVNDIEVTLTVNPKAEVLNAVPTITAEDKSLTVGDTFNALDGVTASDKEDGDITKNIEVISNNVDTSKAGTYEVTYKVADSQGASAAKTIKITVKKKEIQKPTTDDSKKPSGTDTNKKPANPDKQTRSNSLKTGDSANVGLWIAMVVLSGGLLAVIVGKKRSKFTK